MDTEIPILPVLNCLRSCISGNDAALEEVHLKLDLQIDSNLRGSVESIMQASRNDDVERLRGEIKDLFSLSHYYHDMIKHVHQELLKQVGGWTEGMGRMPFDIVADIPLVRRRD